MKIKAGFITNSSSTAFIIINKTNEALTMFDFIQENPHLIEEYIDKYAWEDKNRFTQENLLQSAELLYEEGVLKPGSQTMVFGDEQRNLIGQVLDYMLRDGGESKNFKWKFKESYR